jgi:type II secretory pathway predicted ATPase ExeA
VSADLSPYALDPFGPSANPSAYVACEASERARATLERALDEGRVAAIAGPPGVGKTLLLRLLCGREQERSRAAYVPFCTLEVDELFAYVMNELGIKRPGAPRETLLAAARELAPRGGIAILIDDASSLSDDCARALAALYADAAGAVRIALAAVDGPGAQRVFQAFGDRIDVVHFAGSLSGREARRYVEMRLAYGGARPELMAAFDEATIEALHRASQGVPRRLNQAAQDVVRRATRTPLPRLRPVPPPAAPAPKPAIAPEPERAPEPAIAAAPPAPAPPAPAPAPPKPESVEAPLPGSVAQPVPPSTRPVLSRLAPRTPIAPPRVAPPPAARAPEPPPALPDPDEDDPAEDRGILLPGIFDRVPGEPAGEYRMVRGEPLVPSSGRPFYRHIGNDPPHARQSVLVAPPPEFGRRRSDVPLATLPAHPVEPAPIPEPRLPIRLIGVAGFMIGVGLATTYWVLTRVPDVPQVRVTKFAQPTAPEVPAVPAPAPAEPPAAAPAPPPAREETAARSAPAAPAPAAAATAPRAVAVSINATPWAVVRIDGREVGETPLAGIALEPGPHVFEARMPDGSTREQTVEVSEERVTVVFE